MADNTILPVPTTSGDVIATDDISGVKFQRIKMILGADGVNDGDVSSANPLPVEIQGALGTADTKALGTNLADGDIGLVTNTVIHGKTTAGGGAFVDVKVNPSGALSVSVGESTLPTGAATETTLASIASTIYNHNAPFTDGLAGQLILGKRRDSDSTAVADGDLNTFNMDEEGRLKVSSKPASYPDITGDITAVQATIGTPVVGGTVVGDVSRASNVMAFCTGTFSTVNCTFEGSLEATGDTNWFGIQAVRTNANTIETATGNLSAQPVYGWEMSVNALRRVRVRATARTSGTQSWRFVQGTYATEPIPAAQVSATQPVSGSVTSTLAAATVRAGFIAGAAIWYDDSATVLAGAATFTGTSRDLTVTATATAMANAATYVKELRVSAESDQSGTLWLEVSRDNTNWRRVKSVATAAVTGGGQYSEIVHRPSWRYARVGFTNGATLQTRFSIGSILMAV